MAASVLIGVLLGKYLDLLFGTAPWLGLVFSLFGAGAAIKLVFSFSTLIGDWKGVHETIGLSKENGFTIIAIALISILASTAFTAR